MCNLPLCNNPLGVFYSPRQLEWDILYEALFILFVNMRLSGQNLTPRHIDQPANEMADAPFSHYRINC